MSNTASSSGVMAGKKGLIMGVANDRSIAWGIAAKLAEQGAELAFTFQGEALQKRVEPLAASVGSDLVIPCDVTDEASMDATFDVLKEKNYSGWLVVEAEQDPAKANPLEYAKIGYKYLTETLNLSDIKIYNN